MADAPSWAVRDAEKSDEEFVLRNITTSEDGREIRDMIWKYQGNDVPVEIRWPSEAEMEKIIGGLAQWAWDNRQLAEQCQNQEKSEG